MSSVPRATMLAPFRQRSFRRQWPADLATSWAFEMETLILAWFVLSETGSVVWLTTFGALQFLGTLISPLFGVMGDRAGHKRVLVAMRATYAALAAILATLALTGTLGIVAVFCVAMLSGLVRPSDMGMRNALIGATMPAPLLMGAMSIERTSADAARVVGALTGAALVAWIGIGPAYLAVLGFYLISLALLAGVEESRPEGATGRAPAVWTELAEGVAHVRATPPLMAAMVLAFLANALAYPLTGGLLAHVARDIYGIGQTGLGTLVASFAAGALAGSVFLSARGGPMPPARTMLFAAFVWFALLLAFAVLRSPGAGMAVLALAGFVQSFCMVPMAVLILRVAQDRFRGRVMGLRMLAVYGLPLGLLASGPLVAWFGFAATGLAYAGLALACTAGIAWRWRAHLWPRGAPANAGHG
ncbi:MFS transporter [Roseomonas sp. PWR1]|uniref:MFS transporter n=1 Tax=Roseomonas nitratireducens TaxID=2820810 RepID=A0ABS4ASC9_9PROT|nr:MFS transporter [Neoroseomonas nitratireducens]